MTAALRSLTGFTKRAKSPAQACDCELHDDVVCVAQACCRRCVKVAR